MGPGSPLGLPASSAKAACSAQTQGCTSRRAGGSGRGGCQEVLHAGRPTRWAGPPAVPSLPRVPSSTRALAPGPGPPRSPRSRQPAMCSGEGPHAGLWGCRPASDPPGEAVGLRRSAQRGSGPRRSTGQRRPSLGLLSGAGVGGPGPPGGRARAGRARDPWVPAVTVTMSCPSVSLRQGRQLLRRWPHGWPPRAPALPAGDTWDLKTTQTKAAVLRRLPALSAIGSAKKHVFVSFCFVGFKATNLENDLGDSAAPAPSLARCEDV